jgi:hypothetical protein
MKTRTFIAILWGIAAVSFIGCSTPRKLAGSTKETAKTEEKRNETTAAEFRRTVDNTKTEGVEVTYTKIEFSPPKPDTRQAKPDTMQAGGPSNPVADTPKNRPKEPKEKQPPDTGRQGAIKSIETFTVKQKAEATGVTQEEQDSVPKSVYSPSFFIFANLLIFNKIILILKNYKLGTCKYLHFAPPFP